MRSLRWTLLGLLGVVSQTLAAMPIRCNSEQSLCEVRTTRLTSGDYIGVFSADNLLVAIGVVGEIKSGSRLINIEQSWGTIYRSHRARHIEDEAARNPEEFFRVQKPVAPERWGGSLGVYSMGVGDGVVAYNLGGKYKRLWQDHYFWIAKASYLTGSGNASDNLRGVTSRPLNVSAIMVTGGMVKKLMPYRPVSLQLGVDFGLASVDASIGGDVNVAQVLNDRLKPGVGLVMQGAFDVVWRRESLEPRLGIAFLRLQETNSIGLSLGVSHPL